MGQRLHADGGGITALNDGSGDEQTNALLEEADADDDGAYSEEELNALTKAQLLQIAEVLGVEGVSSSKTKAQIIAAILEKQAEANAAQPGQG